MSPAEARRLLIQEAAGTDAVYVCVRMGDDPGKERLDRIIQALDVLIISDRAGNTLERKLVFALWAIAQCGSQSEGWQKYGVWRDGAFQDQVFEIQTRIEQYFVGALTEEELDNPN